MRVLKGFLLGLVCLVIPAGFGVRPGHHHRYRQGRVGRGAARRDRGSHGSPALSAPRSRRHEQLNGIYRILDLRPGIYKLDVCAGRIQRVVREGVECPARPSSPSVPS